MDSLKSLSPHFLTFTRYLPGQLKGLGEPENHRIEGNPWMIPSNDSKVI